MLRRRTAIMQTSIVHYNLLSNHPIHTDSRMRSKSFCWFVDRHTRINSMIWLLSKQHYPPSATANLSLVETPTSPYTTMELQLAQTIFVGSPLSHGLESGLFSLETDSCNLPTSDDDDCAKMMVSTDGKHIRCQTSNLPAAALLLHHTSYAVL